MTNRKLSLRLQDLRIESFPTADAADAPRGTVQANQVVYPQEPPTAVTCGNTCGCPTWAPESCYPETYCIG